MLGIAQVPDGVARRLFDHQELRLPLLRSEIEAALPPGGGPMRGLSPGAMRVMEQAVSEASALGAFKAGTEHVLLALLSRPEDLPARLLERYGIHRQLVLDWIRQ